MNNLGSNFYSKLIRIASELQMKPEDILAVMVSESGIKSDSVEGKYHGSGLIGFMPDTLKNLGYQGTWEDFKQTSGEDQLDYVKKYIQDKIKFNGGPFKSAAQYYIANFYPVALKLPGIKSGDPDTVFVEEHPATVIGKDGGRYSKKYYDIGIKIDPKSEALAYKTNHLFHGSTPGAITYGDMMRQVEKNKKSNTYKQAIAAMKNITGYQVNQSPSAPQSTQPSSSFLYTFMDKLEKLLHMFANQNKYNDFLISVGSSSDFATTLEYANVLSTAIEEYLCAKTRICADENSINIECRAQGNKQELFEAIQELSIGVSDGFKHATKKIGKITTFALVTADLKSDYEILHPKRADLYNRMFKLKFERIK